MSRVFEFLGELVQVLGETYDVPLPVNCMVLRQRVLELLDELRDAFPAEFGDTRDVLSQRDGIINDAEAWTDNTISSTDEEAHRTVDEARTRANHTVEDANVHAAGTVATAGNDTRHLRESAQHECDSTVGRASAKSDRLVHADNESYERSVAEGREEQAHLVAESTVVREASGEVNRLLSDAYADSSRLRKECDRYTDSRLAESEQTLQETLRNVGCNRFVLRSGIGAVDGGAGAQNVLSSFSDDQEYHRYERWGIFGVG